MRDSKSRLVSLLRDLRRRGWEPGEAAEWDEEITRKNLSALCSSGLRSATLPLAAVAVELLSLHSPDTVRGVMYSVVSAGWLPDTSKQSYGRIQRILNDLRKQRVVPFDWIVDNVRATIKPSSWTGLGDFTETVRDAIPAGLLGLAAGLRRDNRGEGHRRRQDRAGHSRVRRRPSPVARVLVNIVRLVDRQ